MATIDPTQRSAVTWWDVEGPERAKLTVAWLDENNREMAWYLRGLDAFWIAQCFKARDARITYLTKELERVTLAEHDVKMELEKAKFQIRSLKAEMENGK